MAQQVGNMFALPKGQRTLAGGDTDQVHAPIIGLATADVSIAQASEVFDRLSQARHATTTDFQWLLAMAQYGLHAAIVDASQFNQFMPRHQSG